MKTPRSNFHAQIMTQFGLIQIGNFPTAIQAARAYNKKAREWFGKYARLNKIPKGEQYGFLIKKSI